MRILINLLWILLVIGSARSQGFQMNADDQLRVEIYVTHERLLFHPPPGTLIYSVANLNWSHDLTDMNVSVWVLANGQWTRVDARKAKFMAKGEGIRAENIKLPALGEKFISKFITCVSYRAGPQLAEIMSFYTNEDHSPEQLSYGLLTKFRASEMVVDGDGTLCRSMPGSAARFLE